MDAALDAKWILGLNSLLDAALLRPGEYQWSVNTDNTGGNIQTRQGYNAIGVKDAPLPVGEPKGMAVFRGADGITKLIIAIGNSLYALSFPIVKDFKRVGGGFYANEPVIFTKTLQSVQLQSNGSLKVLDKPIPYLIMTNGVERAKYWDGFNLRTSAPEGSNGHPGIPIGKWTQWSGGRLWISQGKKLMASDIGNPLAFFEATYVSGGGALYFDDDITGMTQTTDLQNLLVCTDFDTSAVQSNVTDRNTWSSTPGFQRIVFPGVGCCAGKSFVRQWGITWWMSHGGWIGIDQALMTYQRSRVQYRDQQMMRAKDKLNGDKSRIVANKFGNYLLVAVPYGSRDNAATWVLNQRVLDVNAPSPAQDVADPAAWASQWTGIKPVDFALCVVDGQERLFTLSRHKALNGRPRAVVWELFTGERQDRYNDKVYHPPCVLETRLLGYSEDLKSFRHAYIDVSELLGLVDFQAYFAGRKGNYHLVLDKKIVASPGSVNSPITSQFVTTVTRDVAEGEAFIPVESTDGVLPPPATINIGGRVLTYVSLREQIDGAPGEPPIQERGFDIAPYNPPPPDPPPPPPPDPAPPLPTPELDPPGGYYDRASVFVTISVPFAGAWIGYTTDGSKPTRDNGHQVPHNRVMTRLRGPGTFTVRAFAYLPDDLTRDSAEASEEYEVVGIPHGIEAPDLDAPDEIPLPDLEVPVPFPIRKGSQVIQSQFLYPNTATILTSYVPQRRMLKTQDWDPNKYECSTCGVESPLTDNIDRGFSMLLKWRGRLAVNGIKMMLQKEPENKPTGCEEDEETARAVLQSGCSDKSKTILEPETHDSARLKSQFLRSVTPKTYEEETYNPVPL